jgi:hypothetical protein
MQDYSAYKINAHKRLKEMHSLLLKNKFDEAIQQIDEAIVELRMAKAAVADLKERVQ